MNASSLILALVVAVGLGSIPTGLLVAKFVGGLDIREVGSGNIGATNIYRALGWKWAVAVFGADALKGLLSVVLAWPLLSPSPLFRFAGVVAVAAHIFNPWLRGRGGKGVATAFGVMLVISPWAALTSLAVWVVLLAWKRIVSLASLAAALALPLATALFTWSRIYFATAVICSVLISGLVIFAHRENIKRLRRGEEKPATRLKPKSSSS